MNLRKALAKESISLDLRSDSKSDVIEELMDLLAAGGRVGDRKAALKAVMDREKKMSTGMQNGVAIPHAKTDVVDGLVAAHCVKKGGLDFESLDGKPALILVMTLSPTRQAGPHVQFLAEISRLLNEPSVREQVMAAKSPDEVLDTLSAP